MNLSTTIETSDTMTIAFKHNGTLIVSPNVQKVKNKYNIQFYNFIGEPMNCPIIEKGINYVIFNIDVIAKGDYTIIVNDKVSVDIEKISVRH